MTQTILDHLQKAENLPSLPTVAMEILKLTRDPDSTVDDLAEVIRNDPALSAKILKMVNSSMFGISRQVTSITQAVSLLGMRTVKVLSLSFSVMDLTKSNEDEGTSFDYDTFWRHSLTSAVAGRLLAEQTKKALKEEAFVGGLLSDLGMIAACRCAPDLYNPVLKKWSELGRWDVSVEHELFGLTHARMTSELLSHWGLPDTLCAAIGTHHGEGVDEIDDSARDLSNLIRGAAQIAALFCGDVPSDQIDECKQFCMKLTGIEEEKIETLLEQLADHVQETASLLSIKIGETVTYDQLQMQASMQLAQLSMEAEIERNATAKKEEESRLRADQLQDENKAILEVASTDGLTGIANRASFDKRLLEEIEKACTARDSLSLIMMDVDHFKKFNDDYGQRAGDEVLREVADRVRKTAEGIGYAFRYGGEEFAVLLTQQATNQALQLAEEIRRDIESTTIDFEGNEFQVTASFGAASVRPIQDQVQPKDLIEQADQCLYQAKRAGRNRVVASDGQSDEKSSAA